MGHRESSQEKEAHGNKEGGMGRSDCGSCRAQGKGCQSSNLWLDSLTMMTVILTTMFKLPSPRNLKQEGKQKELHTITIQVPGVFFSKGSFSPDVEVSEATGFG